MAFWSGEKLKEECPKLVSEFSEAQVDCNAYTLRMGNEYYCTSNARQLFSRKKRLKEKGSFVIAPGQFAFLLSKEKISVPASSMAFISIKASVKFRGLINVSGFHVDPGYDGNLVFSVFNAGPSAINLSEGDNLFLIWYADLDRVSELTKKNSVSKAISNDLINGMNREVTSLQSLADEIASLKVSMRVQAIIFGAAVALFLVILGATINFVLQRGIDHVIPSLTQSQAESPPINRTATTPEPTGRNENRDPGETNTKSEGVSGGTN